MLLGIFIYSMTLFVYGEKYLPAKSLVDGVWCTEEMAFNLGFENGDKILAADGKEITHFSDVFERIIVSDVITVDGLNLPAGAYLVQFVNNNNVYSEKLLVR